MPARIMPMCQGIRRRADIRKGVWGGMRIEYRDKGSYSAGIL
jgi:hypothetical protein